MFFDAVIVGAGPSGAHLGYILARKGMRVALVDRKTFPRDKLCGGFLSTKTLELLRKNYSHLDFASFSLNKVSANYELDSIASFGLNADTCIIKRQEFDYYLVREAALEGVTTFFGVPFHSVNFDSNEVCLADGTILSFKILIGADGVNSRLRNLMGLSPNKKGFCMETRIPIDLLKETNPSRDRSISVYFEKQYDGYGWIFPDQNEAVVGLGKLTNVSSEKEIIKKYHQFVNRVAYKCTQKSFGAYVPAGDNPILGDPAHENICLIGDAAGLIDPITGEGIYFALLSAEILSNAIENTNVYLSYKELMTNTLSQINDAVQMRNRLFSPVVLGNFLLSIQSVPEYGSEIVYEAVLTYKRTYREVFREFEYYNL